MSLPVPKLYDLSYSSSKLPLNNASLRHVVLHLWKDLTNEQTVLKYSPEGLLIPNGSRNVMDRLGKIRYVVLMEADMVNSLLSAHNSFKSNLPPAVRNTEDEEEIPRPDTYWLNDCPQNEGKEPDEESEPFSDIPFKWPWDPGDFVNAVPPPVADDICAGPHKDLVSRKSRSAKRTFYHDYCGQYFGSALGFLHYLQIACGGAGLSYYGPLTYELLDDVKSLGDAPLIVLYPETILLTIMSLKYPKYNPEHYNHKFFSNHSKLFLAGLKIVFAHEIGHHMFPIIQARGGANKHPAIWPECMANWYAYHFLNSEERILLHLWSQEVPIEYQSYKALLSLGLSHYGSVSSDLLNVINPKVRASILFDIEKSSSFGWALDMNSHLSLYGEYLIDQEVMNRILSIDHKEFLRRQDRILYNLTPGDELLHLMIATHQYREIFLHFKGLVSRRTIKVGKISGRDYHALMAETYLGLPVSVGYCRG